MEAKEFYQIREHLHRHPELSGQEIRTTRFILQYLQRFSPTHLHEWGKGCGVIAEYCFSATGPTLLFRADIDAVAIQEKADHSYSSEIPGVSHKCGHDGHTTILLALADLLYRHPLSRGRILLLFQPSEENGQGAQTVLQDAWFRQQKIDQAFALHNLPGFPCNTIVCRTGSFTCSVISCAIVVDGQTAHAAEPEKAVSPTLSLWQILQESTRWNRGELHTPDYFRSTLVELHIGEEAYGVAAGKGVLRLTLRAATEKNLQIHRKKLEELIQKERLLHPQLTYSLQWLEPFAANENQAEAVQHIRTAAIQNRFPYQEISHPFPWGEDFGLFTQQFPGAMFGIGAGVNTPALHTPAYDFPNEIIATGARMFYSIAANICRNGKD